MTYIPTPTPADPVEGSPGHFAHTLWLKNSVLALDAALEDTDAAVAVAQSAAEAAQDDADALETLLGAGVASTYGSVAARLTAIEGGLGAAAPNTVVVSNSLTGIDTTGATSSSAGITSAYNSLPSTGGILQFVPGATYRLDAVSTLQNKDCVFLAHGAKFILADTDAAIVMQATMGTTYNVSSFTETISTAFARGEELPVTTLTMGSTPTGWAVGDYVKIAADDFVPPANNTVRSGQVLQIISVSGTTVILNGWLRDTYTTNVRAAKMPTTRVRWYGGTFEANSTVMASGTMAYAPLQASRLIDPIIDDVRFSALSGPAVYTGHTYRAKVNITVDRALDGGSVYGYGLDDGGEMTDAFIMADRVRHAYTTGPSQAAAGGNVGDFGRCFGAHVRGICRGASQAAWDTHGDADSIWFDGVRAEDCYYGIQFRGTNCRATSAIIEGPNRPGAVQTSTAATTSSRSYGHVFDNIMLRNIDGPAFVLNSESDEAANTPCQIISATIINRNTTKYIIDTNVPVQVGSIYVAAGGTRHRVTGTGSITNLPLYTVP